MRSLAAVCCVSLVAACGAKGDHGDAALRERTVPARGALNPLVLEVARAYPTDGTHAYWWPRGDPWRGTTRTLTYGGEVLCEGDPQGRCYCSGLTFEVFLEAWLRWARANGRPERVKDLDLAGM